VSARRTDAAVADIREVVVFMLGEQRYALPIEDVQEIQQIVAMNEVPDRTPGLVGVINLRGQVVPAIDLRQLLGMDSRPYVLETPMVIAHSRGGLAALIVDDVEDVASVPPGSMQPPDEVYEFADKMLAAGRLGPDLVFVLDPNALVPDRGQGRVAGTRGSEDGAQEASAPKPKTAKRPAKRKKAE
jgi:purine-binding chemotaxis protein CheW